MASKSTHLCYGDLIIIYGKQNNVSGTLSATGYCENRVFFQKSPIDLDNPTSQESLETVLNISNYRDMVFQVWPRLSYDASKEYQKLLKYYNRIKKMIQMKEAADKQKKLQQRALVNSIASPVAKDDQLTEAEKLLVQQQEEQWKERQKLLEELDQNLTKLRYKMDIESEANQKQLSTVIGEPVLYGQDLQLMHYDSKYFIKAQLLSSAAEKTGYRFELNNSPGSGMLFKFQPKFKLRQKGEKIEFKDNVILYNIKLGCYVNFALSPIIELDTAIPYQPQIEPCHYSPQIHKNSEKYSRLESFVSNEAVADWMILPYGKPIIDGGDQNIIKAGELIRLKHTETQGSLAADINYYDGEPEAYVHMYRGDFYDEEDQACAIWQIEIDSGFNRGDDLALIDENSYDRQPMRYRLRHFLTGRLLTIKQKVINGINQSIPVLTPVEYVSQRNKTDQQIYFIPTNQIFQNQVLHQGTYSLGLGELKIKISDDDYKKPERTTDPNIYTPLIDKEIQITRKALVVSKVTSAESAFTCIKLDEEEKYNILFIRSSLQHLQRFVEVLRTGQKYLLTSEIIRTTIRILSRLIFYVLPDSDESTDDPIEIDGLTDRKRQVLLKQLNIIEILTDILYFPFNIGLYQLSTLSDKDGDIIKVFQLTNRLIKHTIKEYRPNELYASQWLDMLMKQITIKNCDIKAATTLTELIDNNKYILTNKIKKETIKNFIDLLMEDTDMDYVNLLRALCTIDGQPAQKNQQTVSKELFENDTVRQKLIYPLKIVDDDLQVQVFGEWVQLADFKQKSSEVDDQKSFKYFISLMQLIADLCLARNYIAINKIQDIFTFDKCFELISDYKYDYELRSAFIKITINLWIDREPFELLIFPNKIRIWDDLKNINKQDIYCSKNKEQIQQFTPLKKYILEYLQKLFKKQKYFNTIQTEKNTFTLNLLKLLKVMLKSGFYTSLNELSQILAPVTDLLNGIRDVTTLEEEDTIKFILNQSSLSTFFDKQKNSNTQIQLPNGENFTRLTTRYEITEENQIVVQIKELATIILLIIYDIREDYKVTHFLAKFRKSYEKNDLFKAQPGSQQESFADSLFFFKKQNNYQKLDSSDYLKLSAKQDEQTPIHLQKIQKWLQQIITDNSLQIQYSMKNDFNAIIIDLMLYKYIPLLNNTFDLLYKRFCQRDSLTEYLLEIQIIEDQETLKKFYEIKEISREIKKQADQAELWYGKENDIQAKIQSDQILVNLDRLCQLLTVQKTQQKYIRQQSGSEPDKEPLQLEDRLDYDDNQARYDDLQVLLKEDEQINKQFQQIMRNLEVYSGMMVLLDYDLKFQEQNDETTLKIMNKCYEFLAKFIFKDVENQDIIMDQLEIFLSHIKKNEKIKVNLLIEELVKNNHGLLLDPDNKHILIKIAHTIISKIDSLPEYEIRRTNLLETLRVFMKCKGRAVYDNQIMILNKITSKEFKRVVRYANTQEERQYIVSLLKQFNQQFNKVIVQTLELQPHLDYFCYSLYIIAVTCEDLNAASETKCQTYYNLETLFFLFQSSESCWNLKKAILFYLYHVYLETEREFNEDQRYLVGFLEAIIKDIDYISNNQINQEMILKNHKKKTTIRDIINDYFLHAILPCIDALLERNEIQDFEIANRDKIISDVIDGIIKFCNREQHSKNLIKEIQQTLTIIRFKYPDSFIQHQNKLPDDLRPKPITQLSEIKNNMKELKQGRSKEDMTKSEKVRQLIRQLLETESFQDQMEKEFEEFIKKFVEIKSISQKEFKGMCTLEFQEVCDALVDLVDITEMSLTVELTFVGINIFRKIIERENKEKSTPATAWKPEDWTRYADNIKKAQDKLCDIGVVDVCCNIIGCQDPAKINDDIQLKTVSLAVALLLGGNKSVQNKFYEYMSKKDNKNTFLIGVKQLIDNYFAKISQMMIRKNNSRFNEMIEESAGYLTGNKKNRVTQENIIENDYVEDEYEEQQELKNAIDYFQRIYRMLQLLCEGHNSDIQDHLCKQRVKGQVSSKSINFISYTAFQYSNFVKFVNNDCVEVGDCMLDFLIEAVQGPCLQNQIECTKTKLIGSCNDLVIHFDRDIEYKRRGIETDENIKRLDKLIKKSCKLLLSLLEGNKNPIIIQNLYEGIDFDYFKKRLQFEFKEIVELKLKQDIKENLETICEALPDKYDDDTMDAFNIYILLATLGYLYPDAQAKLEDSQHLDEDIQKSLEFFKSQTISIEINFAGKINKVFFPVMPICRNLSKATRNKIMAEVNRETASEKIQDLVNFSEQIFDEIEHNAKLNKLPINFSPKRFRFLKDVTNLLAFIINIIILITYDWKIDKTDNQANDAIIVKDELFSADSELLITIFGLAQLAVSSMLIVCWLILKAPLVIKDNWRSYVELNQELATQIDMDSLQVYDEVADMPPQIALVLLKIKGPEDRWFIKKGKRVFGHFYLKLFYTWQSIYFLLNDKEFTSVLIYFVFSIIGEVISEVFYSFQMIDIINRFETLRNVIKSITYNANQLVLTALLGILLIYIYSLFGFHYLSSTFYNADTALGEYLCTTMVQCFFTTLNQGLRMGGGIGDYIQQQTYAKENQNNFWFRLFFDLSFFVIINIILLNIIFGIIIDTFAELRDKKNAIDEDMKNNCFICNLDRYIFDKNADGFQKHIERDHHLWNYIYYIYLVKNKMDVNRSGIESYVAEKLEALDNSWFPILKALCLNEDEKEEFEEIVDKNIIELKGMMQQLLENTKKKNL